MKNQLSIAAFLAACISLMASAVLATPCQETGKPFPVAFKIQVVAEAQAEVGRYLAPDVLVGGVHYNAPEAYLMNLAEGTPGDLSTAKCDIEALTVHSDGSPMTSDESASIGAVAALSGEFQELSAWSAARAIVINRIAGNADPQSTKKHPDAHVWLLVNKITRELRTGVIVKSGPATVMYLTDPTGKVWCFTLKNVPYS